MAVVKSKLSVSRELGRNKRIISGVGSGATNGGGGAFGGGLNIMALEDAADFANMYQVIDREGDEAPKKTPYVVPLALATFNSMFELVDNNGNPYIRAKYNFASDGEVMAYADSGQMPASVWDAMPKATASVLGAVKVGNNLTVDADGTLHAAAASGGASTWDELSDKPAWLAHATQAAFEAGHGHDWDSISGKPSTYAPSAHSHSWSNITSKPSSFAPAAHEHPISEVTGLQSALDGKAPTHTHPYASNTHNHNTSYLGISAKAADSNLLDGYDSSAFPRKAESASITGLWSFAVSTGTVPFLVPSGKTGRVINLNADLLDGYHASAFATAGHNHDTSYLGISAKATDSNLLDGYDSAAFPRKAENATIAGLWTFNQRIKLSSQWAIGYDGTNLVFYNASGVKKVKIDQNGNLTASGEVTAFGVV